jgi:hypothetical protein
MATLGADLRTFLTGSTGIAAVWPSTGKGLSAPHVVEQNTFPQSAPDPRIYFQRQSEEQDLDMSGEDAVTDSRWDVEVIGSDDPTVVSIVDAVKSRLHGHRGAFGSRTVLAVFVEDHDDDYLVRGLASEDEAVSVAALQVQILTS